MLEVRVPKTSLGSLTYEYRDDRMIDISLGNENFFDAEGDEILFELYLEGNQTLPGSLMFDPRGLTITGYVEAAVVKLVLFYY